MRIFNILLTPYILVELALAYFYVSAYGFLSLVLEIVATGLIGLFFIFRVGFLQVFNLNAMFNFIGRGSFVEAIGYGFGGFLLFLPGLLTDCLGVVVLVVAFFTGSKAKNTQNFTYYEQSWQNSGDFYSSNDSKKHQDSEIIDVEVVDETKSVR